MRQPTAAALAPTLGILALAAVVLSACGGGDQPSVEAFCQRLQTAFGPQGALAADYSDNPSGAQAVIDELEQVRRVAPLGIESPLTVIIETADLVIGVFSGQGGAGPGAAQLEASGTAAAELNRYSSEHCGLALDWHRPFVPADPDRIPGEVRLDVQG